MRNLFRITTILLALLSVSCSRESASCCTEAKSGFLDLREFSFASPIPLQGEWEFYPGVLLTTGSDAGSMKPWLMPVPAIWDYYKNPESGEMMSVHGAGSFRLRIRLPDTLPREPLVVSIPQQGTAFRIYANRVMIGNAGIPGPNRESTEPDRINRILVLPAMSSSELELIVQIANFHHADGGFWYVAKLGTESQLVSARGRAAGLELFTLGALLFSGFYHLGLYFYRRKESSYLILGLFLLSVGLRIFTTGELWIREFFPGLQWDLQIRIEYLGAFLTPALFILFFIQVFDDLYGKKIFWWAAATLLGFLVPVAITDPNFFTSSLWLNQVVTFAGIPYIFFLLTRATWKQRPGAIPALLGFFIAILGFINDSLHSQDVIHTAYVGPYTVFAFILFQTMVLVSRFSAAHHQAEQLAIELDKKVKERTKSLEETTAQKRQLIHILSHDLRNTLSVILGAAEMLHESNMESGDRESLDFRGTEMILRNSTIGLNLLEDVNRLEALETEKISIRLRPVKIHKAVQNALYLNESLIQKKEIRVINRIPEEMEILADPDFLTSTVLGNLISNAVKFSHPGGEIRIDGKIIEDRIVISIEDDGIGIPGTLLHSLFDLSVPTSRKGTMNEPGTGFGMPLVKRFVESMEGTLEVSSTEGKGTSIQIHFINSNMQSSEEVPQS